MLMSTAIRTWGIGERSIRDKRSLVLSKDRAVLNFNRKYQYNLLTYLKKKKVLETMSNESSNKHPYTRTV